MTDQILESTVKAIASLDPLPIYFWGGGEPLLAGRDFFEKVLALQSRYCRGRNPINSLQSNGLLIDKDWIDFFKQYNFQIGISWDGKEDMSRLTPEGIFVTKKVWTIMQECFKEGLALGLSR